MKTTTFNKVLAMLSDDLASAQDGDSRIASHIFVTAKSNDGDKLDAIVSEIVWC